MYLAVITNVYRTLNKPNSNLEHTFRAVSGVFINTRKQVIPFLPFERYLKSSTSSNTWSFITIFISKTKPFLKDLITLVFAT